MIASFIHKKNEVLLDYCTIFLKKAVNRLFRPAQENNYNFKN